MAEASTPLRGTRTSVPEHCHPLAKIVFAEMRRQGVTYDELEWRSGVLRSTIKAWRTNNRPGLESMEAALGALGWAMVPVPTMPQLPASVREGIAALAGEWASENEILCQLLVTVCRATLTKRETALMPMPRRRRSGLSRTAHAHAVEA